MSIYTIAASNQFNVLFADHEGETSTTAMSVEQLVNVDLNDWVEKFQYVTIEGSWPFKNKTLFEDECFNDDLEELLSAYANDNLDPYLVYLANNHCMGCSYDGFKKSYIGNFGNKKDFVLQQIELRQKLEDADLLGLIHHIDFDSYFDNELSVDYWESDDYYFHNY